MTRIHLDPGDDVPQGDDAPQWVRHAIVAAVLAFMFGCFVQLSRM